MPEPVVRSAVKLPAETVIALKEMQATVARAQHDLEVLQRLGLDVHELQAKLTWAEEARKTLLSEFS